MSEKVYKWLKNMFTSLVCLIFIPLCALIKGVACFVDIFMDSQQLTNFIEIMNGVELFLSDYDGSKEKSK